MLVQDSREVPIPMHLRHFFYVYSYLYRSGPAAHAKRAPVAPVLVLRRVHGHALEAAPAHREGERVAVLEHAAKPAVPLQAQLHEAAALLRRRQAAYQQRLRRVPVRRQLARHAWPPGHKRSDYVHGQPPATAARHPSAITARTVCLPATEGLHISRVWLPSKPAAHQPPKALVCWTSQAAADASYPDSP